APFEGIPHRRLPVVTEMDKVVGALKWALQEMERRYGLFVKHGVRNLESYNRLAASADLPPPAPLPSEGRGEPVAPGAVVASVTESQGPAQPAPGVPPPSLIGKGGQGGVGPPLKSLPFLVIVI